MQNGDISNETPPRIIVMVDVVASSEYAQERKLFKTNTEKKVTSLNRPALSHLWNLSSKYGLSVELAAFEEEGWTEEILEKLVERLEHRGTNPFNYFELYHDLQDFTGDLPYRPNLKGVIDLRERVALYGSWGIELNNL